MDNHTMIFLNDKNIKMIEDSENSRIITFNDGRVKRYKVFENLPVFSAMVIYSDGREEPFIDSDSENDEFNTLLEIVESISNTIISWCSGCCGKSPEYFVILKNGEELFTISENEDNTLIRLISDFSTAFYQKKTGESLESVINDFGSDLFFMSEKDRKYEEVL